MAGRLSNHPKGATRRVAHGTVMARVSVEFGWVFLCSPMSPAPLSPRSPLPCLEGLRRNERVRDRAKPRGVDEPRLPHGDG